MFNMMIGLNILRESYKVLLGLGMIIKLDVLKCDGQCPELIHILVMLIKIFRYKQLLTMTLRCLHNILLGPGVNELLHLKIVLLNSSEK